MFMYGVESTSEGLQKFAAHRLQAILTSMTKRTLLAALFGMVMTVAFQSSAATTVLVVEFVNSGLMNLTQALGIVLGSAVGTSLTIQLIAFQMLDVALGAIFLGFLLHRIGQGAWKHLGQALIGFGIIFVGRSDMAGASAPLKNIPELYSFLSGLGHSPILGILVGLALTVVIQNSTAVFAIMMSLAGQHLLGLAAVVPLVLGTHIGGTVTTLLSSFTARKTDAKRAAWANTGYKVVAAALVYPFLPQMAKLVQWSTGNLERQVANAHLFFALFMVVVFLPFNSLIARGLKRLLPGRVQPEPLLKLKYIDESSLEVPAVALTQTLQEIWSLGRMIWEQMMLQVPRGVLEVGEESLRRILETEKKVDWYHHHISRFLIALSKKQLTDEQMEENINAQFILKELEYVGDELDYAAVVIQKVRAQNMDLTQGDREVLRELYHKISRNFSSALDAMERGDEELAAGVIRQHPEIVRLQRSLSFTALAEVPCAETTAEDIRREEKMRYAKVDLMNHLYSVDEHVVNIAQVVMGIA
ncbi:Sodium-dependent phosphate transport protein [Acididesulfobacillus acetoxydans]|uniref:Na+/Pi-cotransporter protein n=2 Tax=Acididesulfobacillus acetoxydans TaxID=1561005 RepID=A0A8S0WF42_9FIRM|nr:Sodium-dependent phosphate transport protein [Acididesulfobacillus acetoxydans]CEJ09433.1 Na+/Pi-cotransporter protein [Acididesulfobacillus acetoxydans]